ncbi:hypothetical protein SPI_02063 [Niveomyces insectorum RCEF 264]|uniref:Uncharacterized protein n=1 Tax=Niveomyces insectorum RCEF 264 TaxID=1081102 RepID=A0A167XQU6_9HYPO|nr:hypothetical protein SPI_02063 [Niveomyces insectorum RCEF 264]
MPVTPSWELTDQYNDADDTDNRTRSAAAFSRALAQLDNPKTNRSDDVWHWVDHLRPATAPAETSFGQVPAIGAAAATARRPACSDRAVLERDGGHDCLLQQPEASAGGGGGGGARFMVTGLAEPTRRTQLRTSRHHKRHRRDRRRDPYHHRRARPASPRNNSNDDDDDDDDDDDNVSNDLFAHLPLLTAAHFLTETHQSLPAGRFPPGLWCDVNLALDLPLPRRAAGAFDRVCRCRSRYGANRALYDELLAHLKQSEHPQRERWQRRRYKARMWMSSFDGAAVAGSGSDPERGRAEPANAEAVLRVSSSSLTPSSVSSSSLPAKQSNGAESVPDASLPIFARRRAHPYRRRGSYHHTYTHHGGRAYPLRQNGDKAVAVVAAADHWEDRGSNDDDDKMANNKERNYPATAREMPRTSLQEATRPKAGRHSLTWSTSMAAAASLQPFSLRLPEHDRDPRRCTTWQQQQQQLGIAVPSRHATCVPPQTLSGEVAAEQHSPAGRRLDAVEDAHITVPGRPPQKDDDTLAVAVIDDASQPSSGGLPRGDRRAPPNSLVSAGCTPNVAVQQMRPPGTFDVAWGTNVDARVRRPSCLQSNNTAVASRQRRDGSQGDGPFARPPPSGDNDDDDDDDDDDPDPGALARNPAAAAAARKRPVKASLCTVFSAAPHGSDGRRITAWTPARPPTPAPATLPSLSETAAGAADIVSRSGSGEDNRQAASGVEEMRTDDTSRPPSVGRVRPVTQRADRQRPLQRLGNAAPLSLRKSAGHANNRGGHSGNGAISSPRDLLGAVHGAGLVARPSPVRVTSAAADGAFVSVCREARETDCGNVDETAGEGSDTASFVTCRSRFSSG